MSTTKWVLDPAHSELQFKVKHLAISTVTGQFGEVKATAETEGDDFSTAKVRLTADVRAITTNNSQRDAHLKNGDFFDADNHPELIFDGTRLEKTDEDEYRLHGSLTLRGVSKPVALDVEFGGQTKDPWGNTRAGFSVKGKINRKDFGITFNPVTETGGLVVGEEVKIFGEAEFIRQEVLQPA